ncbi:MAG: hypothetical protein V7L23_12550 [Nostoc sp.]|uniref:hypothetical protein n=1 Tax=Nostoc sp. TaxID=1180 RepID=UPI002FF0E0EC
MTRDEVLELMSLGKPCFYTGDILKTIQNRELYILQLTDSTSALQAARVCVVPDTSKHYYNSVWVKFTELSRTQNQ